MIKLIKLSTGEEIIADIELQPDGFRLKNPARIGLTQQGLAMAPFSPFTKSDMVVIDKGHIIFQAELEDEIKNAYNEKFGNGLVTASSGLII